MAKTVYPNNYYGLVFGYGVNTTVVSASWIPGGSYYDDNGNLQQYPPIGVQVYVADITGIAASTLLSISGIGEVAVTGVGSDTNGSYFTFGSDSEPVPAAGASVITPWDDSGHLLVTRANGNSVSLTYSLPTVHDLYFDTQQTSDSGKVIVTLDGASLGTFDLHNASNVLTSILLAASVPSGTHTVVVTATGIASTSPFVYFGDYAMLQHDPETGGEYLYLGPAGTLDDSSNNFAGAWATLAGFAYDSNAGDSVFFYPQLEAGGKVTVRVQKTIDSGIVGLYVNGLFRQNLDLYANPPVALAELTILDTAAGDAPGQYAIELRITGTKNTSSTGTLLYFKSSVVYYTRSDTQVLTLAADYLKQVAAIRGDGAFLDAYDSTRINFDANSLYGCMGLLAAYQKLGDATYLTAVKNFLTWFAGMQLSNPAVPFDDGSWKIGYQVNPNPPPAYIPAISPYDAQGISEIRWVDAVQCLPAFVLWWYSTLSGDNATLNALLPTVRKGIDGFIANNYDSTGFFFSSWQNKSSPTIFLYHDAIHRLSSSGALLEDHDDSDTSFFTYAPYVNWASYAPPDAEDSDEHYTLVQGSYVQFSLILNAGDVVQWLTQTAFDVGIADIYVSTDGVNFSLARTVDCYSTSILFQQAFTIYTAPSGGTYYFRIQHSGTINAAGSNAPGWTRLPSRFTAGQTDVALGLIGLWLMTRVSKYAALAARTIQRFPASFWDADSARWAESVDGDAPGTQNTAWYPMTSGYTVFGQKQSRFFQPASLFAAGLQALEPYQNSEGGFQPPGFVEPEHIFSAFYMLGQNQLDTQTSQTAFNLAAQYLKDGQYFVTIGNVQTGGIVFSKRYPYLYTNISGFACMALAGAVNPITEQLQLSTSRMVMKQ